MRIALTALIVFINFILQSTLFPHFAIQGVFPNTALIIVTSYALLRGSKEGALVGIGAGFLMDVFFNTYIGFAVCGRLFGESGFALLALLIAFWVPISNTIAVSALARAVAKKEETGSRTSKQPSVLRTVLTNPIIIATLAGLAVNMSGLTLPDTGVRFLRHLGNASLSMGLLCIGAGLQFGEIRAHRRLIAASAANRLLVVPVIALAVCRLFSLPPLETGVAVLFAVLPTAQSCYVMTAAMKGNAPAVAGVTTAQTLAAMATIPFWIAIVLLPLSEMLR